MLAHPDERSPGKPVVGGLAGMGGGTLLVYLANGLPNDSPWRFGLLLAAPTVTVIGGILVAAAIYQCKSYIGQWMVDKELRKSKDAITKCLVNPNTSDNHKKEMQKKLENIEAIEVDNCIKNLEGVISTKNLLVNEPPKPPVTDARS